MSKHIKFNKVKLNKTTQSEGFIGALLGKSADPLTIIVLSLMKNVFAPLPTIPSPPAINGAIQKKKCVEVEQQQQVE